MTQGQWGKDEDSLYKGTLTLSRFPLLSSHNLFLETLTWPNSRLKESELEG